MLNNLDADVDLDTRLLGWGTGLFFLVSSVEDDDNVTLSLGFGMGSVNGGKYWAIWVSISDLNQMNGFVSTLAWNKAF